MCSDQQCLICVLLTFVFNIASWVRWEEMLTVVSIYSFWLLMSCAYLFHTFLQVLISIWFPPCWSICSFSICLCIHNFSCDHDNNPEQEVSAGKEDWFGLREQSTSKWGSPWWWGQLWLMVASCLLTCLTRQTEKIEHQLLAGHFSFFLQP